MALAERVLQAYEATGLIPTRFKFYDDLGDKKFGCGLTVLAFQLHGVTPEMIHEWNAIMDSDQIEKKPDHPINRWATALYGKDYRDGFIDGFDGLPFRAADEKQKYQEGYQEGARTWNLLTSHGLTGVEITTAETVGV